MKRRLRTWFGRARRSLSEAFSLDVTTARALIGLFAAGLFIVSTTLFLFAFSVRIRTELVRLGQVVLLRQTGFLLDVDRVGADLFPPRVRVFGLSVRHAGEKPFLTVEEANIVPGVTRSLSGRVAFDWLELRRPQLSLTYENGAFKELRSRNSKPSVVNEEPQPFELPFELYGALVSRGHIDINVVGRAKVSFDGIHLFAAPQATSNFTVDMIVPPAVVEASDGAKVVMRDIRLGVETKGGDLLQPKSVKLRSARFVSSAISVQSAGDLDVQAQTGQGELRFNLDLGVIHTLIPELPPITGTVAMTARLEAGSGPQHLALTADGKDLQLDTMALGSVHAELDATRSGITIKKAQLKSFGGEIDVKGYLVPFGELPTLLEVEWRNVELAEILSGAGLAEVWVTLASNGKAKVEGRIGKKKLSDALLEGKVHIDVLDFRSRDRSYRLAPYLTIIHQENVSIDATMRVFRDRLEVNEAVLLGAAGKMELEARFFFDFELGFRINGESDEMNLARLAPIANIEMTGTGPLIFELGGPYGPPTIDAKVSFEDMSIAGIPLGHVDSRVLLRDKHTLELPDAVATLGNTQADVIGAIDFNEGPSLKITGAIEQGEVADLRKFIPLPKVFLEDLNGDVTGTFAVSGHARAPDVDASFTSSGVEFLGQPFSTASGTIALKRAKLHRVQLNGTVGALGQVNFAIDNSDNDMAFTASLDQISASDLRLLGDAAAVMSGTIKGDASGRLGDLLLGEARASVDKLKVRGIDQGRLSTTFALNDQHVDIVFKGFDDEASGRAVIDWEHNPKFKLDVDFTENDWGPRLGLPATLRIVGGGHLGLEGDFASLQTMRGSFVGKSLAVATPDAVLHATRTTAFRLSKGVVTMDDIALAGRGSELDLSGSVTLAGGLDLKLAGSLAGEAIRPFLPKVEELTGVVPFDIKVRGTMGQPELSGGGSFTNSRLKFDFFPEAIEGLSGKLVLAGQNLLIEDLVAEYGRGNISGQAGIGFDGTTLNNVGFELLLDRVRYMAPGEIPAVVDGRLRIERERNREWLIAGDLKLREIRYVRDVSLDTMLPSFKKRATQTRTLDRSSEAVTYAIDLSADGNLFVDNNLAKVEMKAELKVVGTNQRPGLLGTVSLLRGQLFFNNVTYDVTTGTIDFVERYQIVPRFDLRLRTLACSANIDVSVAGTVDEPRVDARGRDSAGVLSPEDALSCLTLGYRGADSTRAAGNANQNNAGQVSLGVLSTVTGLDQKIRRFIPVDQVRLGYGFSLRSGRTTPRISVVKELAGGIRLKLESSLIDNQDQRLNLEIPFARNSNANIGWSNATEIPNDFGFDLKSHFDF